MSQLIDLEKAAKLLDHDGPLGLLLKGYESRPQQKQMLIDVANAFNQSQIALIEAGTGVGKSMAYLLPAILWGLQNKERILISTHTISLQEQLLHKDIPMASKILGRPIKAMIVKGMSNYVCLKKLSDLSNERHYLTDLENKELEQIENWNETTKEGSRSGLPIVPSNEMWERVCAESDTCLNRRCPFFNTCYFFKARKEAEDAHLLVANHAMLFADIAYREGQEEGKKEGLLPSYSRIILDEAHHLEKIATDFFSDRVSYLSLLRWLGKLGGEKQGRLAILNKRILMHYTHQMPSEAQSLDSQLSIDLPGMRKELLQHLALLFDLLLNDFYSTFDNGEEQSDQDRKIRLFPHHFSSLFWQERFGPQVKQTALISKRYHQSIRNLLKSLEQLKEPQLLEQTQGLTQEILALSNRVEAMMEHLEAVALSKQPENRVIWMESKRSHTFSNVYLVNANLDISDKLAKSLFEAYSTVILCSATLTANQTFTFLKERIGIKELLLKKTVTENVYQSPFDYQKQALFLIPKDMPAPTEHSFFDKACQKIWQAIQASHGNAFVLFTSYTMMQRCYERLLPDMRAKKFSSFKQGDSARHALLQGFKTSKKAVLFGTDSFWEGIDVVGEALQCVILTKLPFPVPTEPIVQARMEMLEQKGQNPFQHYMIPMALVKFKQGFGRLIRHKQDRGCVICLDTRLIEKNYGKSFLKNLPNCQQLITTNDDDFQSIISSHLTKR